MKTKLGNYVLVDLGHQTNESWEQAKVVGRDTTVGLFDENKTQESLLVELSTGERIWVSSWKELRSYK